jgi:hypothetical protein
MSAVYGLSQSYALAYAHLRDLFAAPFVCHSASTLNRITQINCDARISADLFRDVFAADGIVSYVYGNFVNARLRGPSLFARM